MNTKEIKIEGMSCMHCVSSVEKALSNLELEEFSVEKGKAKVTYSEENLKEENIYAAIEDAGYTVVK